MESRESKNREINVERWVSKRLAALREPPPGWQADSAGSFARFHVFAGAMQRRRRRSWMWGGAAASAACLALLFFAPQAYCAGGSCRQDAPAPVAARAAAQATPKSGTAAKPGPIAAATPAPAPAATPNFKETGWADAPIVCEVYSDYECPACAAAFREVIPLLTAGYVRTGKVRLVHRDFPLPQHQYSRLAARYANAAGRLGDYEAAVAQLFRTQDAWAPHGGVDAQLMQVLPPGDMQKIREMVKSDATLDDTVAADMAMARRDRINSTPSLIVVKNGHRQLISPVPAYSLLKSYLDQLLAGR